MTMYFAADGSYGSADEMLVVNTSNWTQLDFKCVEECGDDERLEIASAIAKRVAVGNSDALPLEFV
jgi:hypothetical protein